MRAKVQIYAAKDGWRWRIQARNGKIIAESGEAYTTQAGAIRGISFVYSIMQTERINLTLKILVEVHVGGINGFSTSQKHKETI